MKLYHAPMSPYARKVRALLIETGLAERVQEVVQDPRRNSGGFHRKNPLARIPALETDSGEVLFDSPVICEYLDSLHRRRKLFPAAGKRRWTALKLQAMGDGIMDAAVPLRQERLRPAAERSAEFEARMTGMIERTLTALEREAKAGALGRQPNIGLLAVACALGYLDLRYPELGWRRRRPALTRWYEAFAQRPSIARTVPAQA